MSNAIDDKELDEYLSGDTQYSKRYRSIAADDVPTELDKLVLTQASAPNVAPIKKSAMEKHSSQRTKPLAFWMRVSVPVALAASVVLVVSVVIDSGVQFDSAPTVHEELKKSIPQQQAVPFEQPSASSRPMSPEPTIEPKASDTQESYAVIATEQSRARMDVAAEQARQGKAKTAIVAPKLESAAKPNDAASTGDVSALSSVQAAAPAAAALPAAAERQAANDIATADKRSEVRRTSSGTGLEEVIVTGSYTRQQNINTGAGPRGNIPPASFEEHELSDAELAKQYREATPTVWLTYIRELRSSGKSSTADHEWRRFVKAYPTYSVDEGDSARPKK